MPPNRSLLRFLCASLAACGSAACLAAAPVLVDASEWGLRDDLAWLADRGRISLGLSTWPQPIGIIERAVERASTDALDDADRDALDRVRATLQRLRGGVASGVRVNTAQHPSAGADPAPRARVEAYAQVQGTGFSVKPDEADDSSVAWRLRARLQEGRLANEPSPAGADGSYIAAGGDTAVLSLGQLDRWWGPGRFGSVILGDAAPPVPTVALRRATEDAPTMPWLAWIGPWSYELSIGQPQHYQPAGAKTIGIRLVARPLTGLEIGLARYIYWGGDHRSNGLSSLRKALLGQSNVEDPTVQGQDPSNEIAGVDLRYAMPVGRTSWTGYLQVVGEDEAGYLPSQLITTAGLQLKYAAGGWRHQWTLEGSDTRIDRAFGLGHDGGAAAYRHGTFVAGHYNEGLPVGAFIGGNGVAGGLGLVLAPPSAGDDRRYEARLWSANVSRRGVEVIDAAYGTPGTVKGLLLQASGATPQLRWRAGLSVQDYPASGRRTTGLTGGVEWPLEVLR